MEAGEQPLVTIYDTNGINGRRVMKIYQDENGWWLEPEGIVDEMTIPSLSGPWANKEAAMLASFGKVGAAHDAERRGGR